MDTKSSWVIGGTTLIGTGVGFVFLALHQSGLLFVASIHDRNKNLRKDIG